MDFQKLLDIAAQNKKKAEKEVVVNKRYTTALPPPKKEKRSGVDHAAIRARLEKKQHDQKQKVLEEESKKKELLKLRAEAKSKTKKSTDKPQENRRRQTAAPKEKYENSKHEIKHHSFMKKIKKVSERTRDEDEIKVVNKRAPDLSKRPKKPAVTSKGPMNYEQLLALAANQQKGDKEREGKTKPVTDSASKSKQLMKKSSQKTSEMDLKKAAAARKLGEMRRQEFLAQRRGGDESGPSRKSNSSMTNGGMKKYKNNGKTARSELQKATSGLKNPNTVTSRPETSTAKTKHSSVPNGGIKHKSAGSSSKSIPNNPDRRVQQSPARKKTPMTLTQTTVDQYFDEAPSGHRPRPVPDRRPEPKRQSKMEKYLDRVPSSSRPQPGSDRRAPSMGQQMPRKRPVSSAPSFQAKRGRLLSDEESDYEEDGFIDDTPLKEEEGEDVSHYIKEIFGYDKSKYGYESEYALRNMEASYREIQKEEARSSRIGMMEDLEDIRREREENKRLAQKKNKR